MSEYTECKMLEANKREDNLCQFCIVLTVYRFWVLFLIGSLPAEPEALHIISTWHNIIMIYCITSSIKCCYRVWTINFHVLSHLNVDRLLGRHHCYFHSEDIAPYSPYCTYHKYFWNQLTAWSFKMVETSFLG